MFVNLPFCLWRKHWDRLFFKILLYCSFFEKFPDLVGENIILLNRVVASGAKRIMVEITLDDPHHLQAWRSDLDLAFASPTFPLLHGCLDLLLVKKIHLVTSFNLPSRERKDIRVHLGILAALNTRPFLEGLFSLCVEVPFLIPDIAGEIDG
jgi:hypothetical protein